MHKKKIFNNLSQSPYQVGFNPDVNVEFDPEVPQAIMGQDHLYMLIQVIDPSHLRIGFRGDAADPWYFSEILDTQQTIGTLTKLGTPCLISFQGVPQKRGWEMGNYPEYHKFHVDYIHYRFGLTDQQAGSELFSYR